MIKKFALNKIAVSTLCLVLLSLFYFLPTHENINIETIENNKLKESVVYLLDNDNYVSKVITYFSSETIEDEIKNRVNALIKGCVELNNFYPLIPPNSKLNSIKIDKNNVYLDFNNEILNVNKYLEEKMIESIVYSLTDINGIDNIYITINGKEINKIKSNIDYPLNRNIGINKKYDLDNLKNINKTTVFFIKNDNDNEYFVPVTNITNSEDEKIEVIIKELKSSINSQNNLKSYFDDSIKLINYEIKDNKMMLLFDNNDKLNEKLEKILSSSIFENYKVDEIEISFNDKIDKTIIKR